jgi:hypothetical protein
MFMFEAVAFTGVPLRQPANSNGEAAAPPAPAYRRPGYPGCRHFNENYIGSWLKGAGERSESR